MIGSLIIELSMCLYGRLISKVIAMISNGLGDSQITGVYEVGGLKDWGAVKTVES